MFASRACLSYAHCATTKPARESILFSPDSVNTAVLSVPSRATNTSTPCALCPAAISPFLIALSLIAIVLVALCILDALLVARLTPSSIIVTVLYPSSHRFTPRPLFHVPRSLCACTTSSFQTTGRSQNGKRISVRTHLRLHIACTLYIARIGSCSSYSTKQYTIYTVYTSLSFSAQTRPFSTTLMKFLRCFSLSSSYPHVFLFLPSLNSKPFLLRINGWNGR